VIGFHVLKAKILHPARAGKNQRAFAYATDGENAPTRQLCRTHAKGFLDAGDSHGLFN
jgi:hypothetical protein